MLNHAVRVAMQVAPTDMSVLITGESGSGKESFSKIIHNLSHRKHGPFTAINCGSIPEGTIDSELFGHEKGSFTGAHEARKGYFEVTNGGTIFLDEIGEMPLDLQVRILRVIQEHEIEKVGATTPIKVDVRVIAATHRNLAEMVKEGRFREDLYYRLLVVPITLPALRDREGDVPELVQHFFLKLRARHGRADLVLPASIVSLFSQYRWPGNIRELENTVERIVLLARGPELSAEDLPDFLKSASAPPSKPVMMNLPDGELNLEAIEKQLIQQAMEKYKGNQTRAAKYLSMTRRALGYRLEKYALRERCSKSSRMG